MTPVPASLFHSIPIDHDDSSWSFHLVSALIVSLLWQKPNDIIKTLIHNDSSGRCHQNPWFAHFVLQPLQFSTIFQTQRFCLVWFIPWVPGGFMLRASGSCVLSIRILFSDFWYGSSLSVAILCTFPGNLLNSSNAQLFHSLLFTVNVKRCQKVF